MPKKNILREFSFFLMGLILCLANAVWSASICVPIETSCCFNKVIKMARSMVFLVTIVMLSNGDEQYLAYTPLVNDFLSIYLSS